MNLSSLRGAPKLTTFINQLEFATTKRAAVRNSSGSGVGEEGSITQMLDWLGACANGDMIYRYNGSWERFPKGSTYQYLRMNSDATYPEWGTIYPRFVYTAGNFNPVTASHPITTTAGVTVSTTDADVTVVAFDPVTSWAVGFGPWRIPIGAIGISFTTLWQAVSSPAASKNWVPQLYSCLFTEASVLGAWGVGIDLTAQNTSDATWHIDQQNITLNTLGYAAGEYREFCLARNVNAGLDDLALNVLLAMLEITFY